MENQQEFKVGVFGIIFNKEREVLLCHRTDYDLWNLPGGRLESGETPWDAVIREVFEETGLEVIIGKLAGIYSKPQKNELVFSFVCEHIGGDILLNEEADSIKYFNVENLPENIPLKHVERIKDTLENNSETVLKIQEGESSLKAFNK